MSQQQTDTALLFEGILTPINMGGQFQDVDVRAFREVRIFTRSADSLCQTGADWMRVQIVEASNVLDLDAFELDCVGTGVTRLYELPGRTLHLGVTGFGTHHVVVFGRP